MRSPIAFARAVVVVSLVCAHVAAGGDLNPPAGPVAPTPGPEPRIPINAANTPGDGDATPSLYKITQSGSYYLTGNITGLPNRIGIEIASSGVTLDLNGFDLVGVPGMGPVDGVHATEPSLSNIAIINGSIRDWGAAGINLASPSVTSGRIEDVLVNGNSGYGIRAGRNCVITNCTASNNGSIGFVTLDGCTLTSCSATLNNSYGIYTSNGCTLTHCAANQNRSSGFEVGGACTLTGCSAYFNAQTFGGNGFHLGDGSSISASTAYGNNGIGIDALPGCTIIACDAQSNTLDGIKCTSACVVRGNACISNGPFFGAGIHATASDNHIDGNTCVNAFRGIDVDGAGNFIARNICSGNSTNWDVAAGNIILVINATAAGAVTGDSGGVAPGSTDPNANFTY